MRAITLFFISLTFSISAFSNSNLNEIIDTTGDKAVEEEPLDQQEGIANITGPSPFAKTVSLTGDTRKRNDENKNQTSGAYGE